MRPRPFLLLIVCLTLALMAAGEVDADKEPEWSYTTGGDVRSVAISADGEYIAGGSRDNKVYLFDKDNSTPLWSYDSGVWMNSTAISADGKYVTTGQEGSAAIEIYLFDKDNNTPLWSYTTWDPASVAISADGEYIAAASAQKVHLYKKNSSTPLWSYDAGSSVLSVSISADGEYIAAGSYDSKVYLFDKGSSTPLWSYDAGSSVLSVAISADGEYIAAGAGGRVYLFHKDNSTPLWSYTTGGDVHSVAISTDGEYIAAGSRDDKVYLFDRNSSTPLWSYNTNDTVFSVDISADGKYIVAGSRDGTVYLFSNNILPTAHIDSISPSPARSDAEVTFSGTGTDSDGTVVAYEWYSSIDGFLSDDEDFSITGFTVGNRTISFRVQDNDGDWSAWSTAELYVYPNAPPDGTIDSIEPSPAEKGRTVFFNGTGSDSDGTVVTYLWESSIDGELSTNEDFSSSDLSLGRHIITFQVQDNDGEWSTISDVRAETYEQSLTGWRLEDTEGNWHNSDDYYKSGVTLVEFFHSKCPHCNEQAPNLNHVYYDYRDNLSGFFSIGGFKLGSSQDDMQDIYDFRDAHSSGWPHLYDINGDLMSAYGLSNYPSFVLVKDGDIVWSHSGDLSYNELAAVLDGDYDSWNAYSLWIYAVPVAIAGQDSTGTPGVPLQFSGAGTDEDGTIAKYEWDFDGDGVFEWSSTENGLNTYIYNNKGTYTATLRITDNDGFTDTDTVVITVTEKIIQIDDEGNVTVTPAGEDEKGIPAPSLAVAVAAVAVIALRRRR